MNPGDAILYQYHRLFGFWGIPNIKKNILCPTIIDEEFEVIHNEQGNRDKPVGDIEKSILCMGGSHTWGAGIDQNSRYTDFLQNKIDHATVLNLGHCSLGLDQICIYILKKSLVHRPTAIVIEQYPWSVTRVLNNYVNGYLRPHFYLDKNNRLKLNKINWLSKFKIIRRLIGSAYQFKKDLLEFKFGIDLTNRYNPLRDPIFLYWKANYYDYMYTLTDKILSVIRDFTTQNQIKLFFAVGAILQQFSGKSKSDLVDYDLPKKRFIHLLEKNRIEYIDLSIPMINSHSEKSPVIFSDGHMNQRGHEIFSEHIYTKLSQLDCV